MDALLALLIATVASFIGSLQSGLVNTAVLADTLRHGKAPARQTALGGALPEILYAGLAFLAADRVLAGTEQWGITPHRITAVVLIGLGLYIALVMRPFHIKEEASAHSGFRKGFLLALMNPQLVLFWCGVRLGMEVLGLQLHGCGGHVRVQPGGIPGSHDPTAPVGPLGRAHAGAHGGPHAHSPVPRGGGGAGAG